MGHGVEATVLQVQAKAQHGMGGGIVRVYGQEMLKFRFGFSKPLLFQQNQSMVSVRIHRSAGIPRF